MHFVDHDHAYAAWDDGIEWNGRNSPALGVSADVRAVGRSLYTGHNNGMQWNATAVGEAKAPLLWHGDWQQKGRGEDRGGGENRGVLSGLRIS